MTAPPDQLAGLVGAAIVLAAVLAAAIACLTTRGRAALLSAWTLAAVSALCPVTNGPLEGPVLLTLNRQHGVTVTDLVAVAGFLLAAGTLWRARPDRGRPRRFVGLVALAAGGILAAYAARN